MITIIAGTNRPNSRSLHVAQLYLDKLAARGEAAQIFSLTQLTGIGRDAAFVALEAQYLLPAEKYIMIVPEYNGSFPGILKLMIDNSDVRRVWPHKKVMLTGLADGRGGNARGIDQLTNVLHYLKANVYYNKLPLSRISEEMDPDGNGLLHATLDTVQAQLEGFLAY